MSEATTRPWEVIVDNDSPYGDIFSPGRETVIATMTGNGQGLLEIKANAELIVLAVNTFDQARKAIQGLLDIGKRDLTNPKYDGYFESLRNVLVAMEATHE